MTPKFSHLVTRSIIEYYGEEKCVTLNF